MIEQRVIDTLNELIAVCKDNETALRETGPRLKSDGLRTSCIELAAKWSGIAEALRTEVIYEKGAPKDGGSVMGRAYRFIARVKATVSGNQREALLDELEQLSERALNKFDEAINRDLPSNIAGIVALQRNHVKDAFERICDARKAARTDSDS